MKLNAIIGTLLVGCVITAWLASSKASGKGVPTVFSASGAKAAEWAKAAKSDSSVEIVVTDVSGGEIDYRSVPKANLDEHLEANTSVLVRRWRTSDEMAVMTRALAQNGYGSDMADYASELEEEAASQQAAFHTYALASTLLGVSALALIAQKLLARRRRLVVVAQQTNATDDASGRR